MSQNTGTIMNSQLTAIALWVTAHVIIPLSIMAAVTAFLYFLIDVRSAFFPGSNFLKHVGTLFVIAAVLIVRYGRMYQDDARQGVYVAALAFATLMAVSSFSNAGGNVVGGSGAWSSMIVNVVVIAAVWWLANALTRQLSIENPNLRDEDNLPFISQLEHEKAKMQQETGGADPAAHLHSVELAARLMDPKEKKAHMKPELAAKSAAMSLTFRHFFEHWVLGKSLDDLHGNPSAGVARLAVTALLISALAEPVILSAAPEVGRQAFASLLIFCLSTGVLLAAGSSFGMWRHVLERGGRVDERIVPFRLISGAALTILILAAAVAVPGVRYEGSGMLETRKATLEQGGNAGSGTNTWSEAKGRGVGVGQGGLVKTGTNSSPASHGFLAAFIALGKFLLVPIVIGVMVFFLIALYRVRGHLSAVLRRWQDRFRSWLQAFSFRWSVFQREDAGQFGTSSDPFAGLENIARLSPSEAVIAAYHAFLRVAQSLDYARAERLTPTEFLRRVPPELRAIAGPAKVLTELYVGIAYGPRPAGADARARAIQALSDLRAGVELLRRSK